MSDIGKLNEKIDKLTKVMIVLVVLIFIQLVINGILLSQVFQSTNQQNSHSQMINITKNGTSAEGLGGLWINWMGWFQYALCSVQLISVHSLMMVWIFYF